MKLFKLFLLLPLCLLFITSCDDDEDPSDDGPDVATAFVGNYTGTVAYAENGGFVTVEDQRATLDKIDNNSVRVSFTSGFSGTLTFDADVIAGALVGTSPVTVPDDDDYTGGAVISGGKLLITLAAMDDPTFTITFTED